MALFEDLKIFTGNAHPALAADVCSYLGISLGKLDAYKFVNDNTFVQIQENVATPVRVTVVVPFYAYGRSDKKDQPRVPITARLIANLFEVSGADRVLTVDLHAGQIQGFFNIPLDELSAVGMLAKHFKERNVPNLVVAATDVGGGKHARNTARFLDAPIAIAEKMRIGNEDRVEVINLIGDVQGKNVLIVDDEIGTGGTVVATANTLVDHGAKDIYCYATHAIYAGSATQVLEQSPIKEIVVTDTLPLSEEARGTKTKTVSVASLLGEAIHRIHSGLSVGAMFDQ